MNPELKTIPIIGKDDFNNLINIGTTADAYVVGVGLVMWMPYNALSYLPSGIHQHTLYPKGSMFPKNGKVPFVVSLEMDLTKDDVEKMKANIHIPNKNEEINGVPKWLSVANGILDEGGSTIEENFKGTYRITSGKKGASGHYFSFKYYDSGWRGGSRARITTYSAPKLAGGLKAGGLALTFGLGALEIQQASEIDKAYTGEYYGYNAKVATGRVAGSVSAGAAGAWMGVQVGGFIGSFFGGVGAVPGAVIGGFVGGVIWGYYAGEAGGELGEDIAKKIIE